MSVPRQLLEFPRLTTAREAPRPLSPVLGPPGSGPILVATDGGPAAAAATRLGAFLARQRGAELQALCAAGPAAASSAPDIRPAVERDAALIVMGLPRRGAGAESAAARTAPEEPTLRVARHA